MSEIEVTNAEINRTALEIICQLSDIPVQTNTMHKDWVVLTYDLPNTVAGRQIRNEFLKKAKILGAVMHNESTYMIPNNSASNSIIAKMASVDNANICVFYSEVKDEAWVTRLTDKYDRSLYEMLKKLQHRLEKMEDHVANENFGLARRMSKATWEHIDGLTVAAAVYGHEKVANELLGIINRVKLVESSCDYGERKNVKIV